MFANWDEETGAAPAGSAEGDGGSDDETAGSASPNKSESCASTLKVAAGASGDATGCAIGACAIGTCAIEEKDGSMRDGGASGMNDFDCGLAKNPSVPNAAGDGF
jgi:hypothetical protein